MLHYIMPGLKTGIDIVINSGSLYRLTLIASETNAKKELLKDGRLKPFNINEDEWDKLLTNVPEFMINDNEIKARYIGSYFDNANDLSLLLTINNENIHIFTVNTDELRGVMPYSFLRSVNTFVVNSKSYGLINDWRHYECKSEGKTLVGYNKLTNEITIGKIFNEADKKAVNKVIESYSPLIKARVYEIDGEYTLVTV